MFSKKPLRRLRLVMDDFDNNPFRNLEFNIIKPDAIPDAVSDADKRLFAREWQRLPDRSASNARGFLLSDLVKLPEKVKKIKKAIPRIQPVPHAEETDENWDEVFLQAVRTATPLRGKGRRVSMRPVSGEIRKQDEPTLEDYLAEKLEFAVSSRDEYLEGHVVGLDELILNRLKEGQFSPEANLDLHGLNSEQAYETLKEFIRQAWYKDLRTVLLVPGRGLNSPNGMGILRQKIQYWLTREPFKRIVLAFCTARPFDGGPGSIYVLLRRYRKKGPIQWERMFVEGEWE